MQQSPARGPSPPVSPAESSLRILIVDDNRNIVESLKMLLDMRGNSTQAAYDGLEAVEVAERFRPEVILLDLGLPKLDGYETCKRIRQQPWGREMMVFAVTAHGHDEAVAKSQLSGFDMHLVKPVEPEILLTVLEVARAQRNAH